MSYSPTYLLIFCSINNYEFLLLSCLFVKALLILQYLVSRMESLQESGLKSSFSGKCSEWKNVLSVKNLDRHVKCMHYSQ